jgi:hypothetical protein
LENLGIDVRILLKWVLKTAQQGMDWIKLAQDRHNWWALIKIITNLSPA